MTPSFPILLYHHVAPDRDVTPEAFETQLRWLLDAGYKSLSLDQLLGIIRGNEVFDGPGFVVTFDDGYFDNWACAFPILKKLNVQATYYLVTERVERSREPRPCPAVLDTKSHERDAGGFLSWAEARAMVQSGLISFGSHTHTHRHFVRVEPYRDLRSELTESKMMIEKELGIPCRHLAWPWGDFDNDWMAEVVRLGYRTAATTLAGANAKGTDPLRLKRITMRRGGVESLATRLLWNRWRWSANAIGSFYGLDRRVKVWWNKESPYAHG